jgi:hypothetical protein
LSGDNINAAALSDTMNYNLMLINDATVIRLSINDKAAYWPLFAYPRDDNSSPLINFDQYPSQQDNILNNWCFFYGHYNKEATNLKNCRSHKTCSMARSEISSVGVKRVLMDSCKATFEKSVNKRKKLKRSASYEESKVIMFVWPEIKGTYLNCVSVINGMQLLGNSSANETYYMMLTKTCDGQQTWLKMNATLSCKLDVEKVLKFDPDSGQIISLDKNQLQYLPYERVVPYTEGSNLHLGTIDSHNVKVVYEDDTQFTLFRITYENECTAFINMVKTVLYGEGFNKCKLVQSADNEMTFVGRIQNLNINIGSKIQTLAEIYGVVAHIQNEVPQFHQIESIKMLSSCSVYSTEKSSLELFTVTSLDLKKFVAMIVEQYNVKVTDIEVEQVEGIDCFSRVRCNIVGLPEKIIHSLVNNARSSRILSNFFKAAH